MSGESTTILTFDLRPIVVEVLENLESADPKDAVTEIMLRIPESSYPDIIQELLKAYVIKVNTDLRRRKNLAGGPWESSVDGSDQKPIGPLPRSSRWDSVSSLSKTIRRLRVNLGDHDWKYLEKLTIIDVETVARRFYERAQANETQAKKYARLHEAMRRYEVPIAGALPDHVLLEVFG